MLAHLLSLPLMVGAVAIAITGSSLPDQYTANQLIRWRNGPRFFDAVVNPYTQLELDVGYRRQKDVGYENYKTYDYVCLMADGGEWFVMQRGSRGGLTASGQPELEWFVLTVRWHFLFLVGLVLLGLSLLPPGGRTVKGIYSGGFARLKKLGALVSGRDPQRRGFDVLPR